MEGNDRTKELTEELIKEVDETVDSPNYRARVVLTFLKHSNYTTWDITCFCVEYLGMVSVNEWPWLTEAAKKLARLVYSAHYFYPQNVNARLGSIVHKQSGPDSIRESSLDRTRTNPKKS